MGTRFSDELLRFLSLQLLLKSLLEKNSPCHICGIKDASSGSPVMSALLHFQSLWEQKKMWPFQGSRGQGQTEFLEMRWRWLLFRMWDRRVQRGTVSSDHFPQHLLKVLSISLWTIKTARWVFSDLSHWVWNRLSGVDGSEFSTNAFHWVMQPLGCLPGLSQCHHVDRMTKVQDRADMCL
jgi:hypothetical protein